MNGPGTRSAPAPALIRPNSSVPNTTSSRPETAASTRAHTRWNTVAGDTPLCSGRVRRSRAATSGSTGPPDLADLGAVAADVGEAEGGGGFGDVGEQAGEVAFVLLARGAEPGLGHEVAERQRLGQPGRVAGQQRGDLGQYDVQRGVVDDQVVDPDQGQPAVRAGVGGGVHVQQRGAGQVHPRAGRSEQLGGGVRGPGSRVSSVTGRSACRQTTWTGSGRPSQAIAVRKMSCRPITCARAARKSSSRSREANRQHRRQHVDVAAVVAGDQVVEEDAFLERGQRVDVGHVGRAAGDGGGDGVDLVLGQVRPAGACPG